MNFPQPLLTGPVPYIRDLNYVIMDYLIREGYPCTAQKFSVEANIQPTIELESIQERVEIRNAVYGGDIQSAIEKINELNPQVCLSVDLPPSPNPSVTSLSIAMIRHLFHAPLI